MLLSVLLFLIGWVLSWWLLGAYPGGVSEIWAWLQIQPVYLQIAVWLLTLPYMLVLWALQGSTWEPWLRTTLVAATTASSVLALGPWRIR